MIGLRLVLLRSFVTAGLFALNVCCACAANQPQLILQIGHTEAVLAVAISPDDRFVASGGSDALVQIVDVKTGAILDSFPAGGKAVYSLAFSPDGHTLAVGSEDAGVRLYAVPSFRLLSTWRLTRTVDQVTALAFSHNGRLLAASSVEGNVKVWRLGTGALQSAWLESLGGHPRRVTSLKFSPDDTLLAVAAAEDESDTGNAPRSLPGKSGAVDLRKPGSGALALRVPVKTTDVYCAGFSPDGSSLTALIGSAVTRIPVHGGHPAALWNLPVADSAEAAASPDGANILVCSIESAGLYEAKSGDRLFPLTFIEQNDCAFSGAYSPDGKYIVTGSSSGSVQVWNVAARKTVCHIRGRHMPSISQAIFSPNGSCLAVAVNFFTANSSAGDILIFDTATGAVRRRLSVPDMLGPAELALTPDGGVLACQTMTGFRSWNFATGKLLCAVDGMFGGLCSPGYSTSLKSFITATIDGKVKAIDPFTGAVTHSFSIGQDPLILSLAVSPDGGKAGLCILRRSGASIARSVEIWDIAGGARERVLLPPSQMKMVAGLITRIFYVPHDSGIALESLDTPSPEGDGEIFLIDLKTGKKRASIPESSGDVAFSSDGKWLVTPSMRVWGLSDGKLIRRFKDEENYAHVALSPDNATVAPTNERDDSIVLRALSDGRIKARLWFLPQAADAARFSWLVTTPDGYYDASPEAEKLIRWRVGDRLLSSAQLQPSLRRPNLVRKSLR